MAEVFSFDSDAMREKVVPAAQAAASQADAYGDGGTDIIDFANQLGNIAYPIQQQATEKWQPAMKQWASATAATLREQIAEGGTAAANAIDECEDMNAAAIQQASENA